MTLNEFIDILIEFRNKEPSLEDAPVFQLENPDLGFMESIENLPNIFYNLKEDIPYGSLDSYGYEDFDSFYEENENEYSSMEEALTAFNNLYSPVVVI